MDAITTRQIRFSYGDSGPVVLRDLDLHIPQNAITAVLGPNGSGKTTLLRIMIGLLRPTQGELLILGRAIDRYCPAQIKRLVGLVPQNESLPFDLTLLEYVLLGRAPFLHLLQRPGDDDTAIAIEAIRTVGLEKMMPRIVATLSSGERQLAAICRILTQTPAILLLDEPTSHLDLGNSRRILRLLKTIAQTGSSVVFTTHDPNAASAVANHVVMVGKSGLVAAGDPDHTLTDATLSATYGQAVEVVHTRRGPVVMAM
jgi:iron complex transport system ATP-binding protein